MSQGQRAAAYVEILGLRYANLDREELAKALCRRAKEGRFTAVFTPNAVIAAEAEKSAEKKALLREADLLLADGIGVTVASRLSFSPPPCRNAGIDMAEALFPLMEREGLRLFLYGGKAGVAEEARRALLLQYPQLTIGVHDGYTAGAEAAIAAFSPHVLLVCLGFPKQERFILSMRGRISSLAMGLGGSLDVWAGRVPRAPLFFQRAGLEWLWRVAREPRRILRLLPLPRFFVCAAYEGYHKLIQKPQKRRQRS